MNKPHRLVGLVFFVLRYMLQKMLGNVTLFMINVYLC